MDVHASSYLLNFCFFFHFWKSLTMHAMLCRTYDDDGTSTLSDGLIDGRMDG